MQRGEVDFFSIAFDRVCAVMIGQEQEREKEMRASDAKKKKKKSKIAAAKKEILM